MAGVVALFQGPAKPGDREGNVLKMKLKMEEAKKMGADLIVFPELFTVGYKVSSDCMTELAEDRSGGTFQQLSLHARETGIAVLYGYPEVETSDREKVYNSAQFVDKEGVSLANYRKTHLWISETSTTEAVFTPGESFYVFEFLGMKIGLLICFDVEFPEAVRTLALRGAQVVLVPTACDTENSFRIITQAMVASRAHENEVYVAYVNYNGDGGVFGGHTLCCGPDGETVVSTGPQEETILLAQIDTRHPKKINYLSKRRPEIYKEV